MIGHSTIGEEAKAKTLTLLSKKLQVIDSVLKENTHGPLSSLYPHEEGNPEQRCVSFLP